MASSRSRRSSKYLHSLQHVLLWLLFPEVKRTHCLIDLTDEDFRAVVKSSRVQENVETMTKGDTVTIVWDDGKVYPGVLIASQ